jgi:anti-sigma factor (TIGR02949 family)
MTVIPFGQSGCEKIRRYLDSYLDGELLVETNHEVLRHLESCSSCAADYGERLRVRERLKHAVRAEEAGPELRARIRASIREESAWSPWRRGLMAAGILFALIGGWFGVQFAAKKANEWALLEATSHQLAQIFQVGLGDHIHCAVFRKYPKNPPPLEKLAENLDARYGAIVRAVRARTPERYRIVLAHHCTHRGRRFIHLVLTDGRALASLAITEKRPGDELVGAPGEAGIHRAGVRQFQVAAFEAGRHLAYLVSDLPGGENLALALAISPAVRTVLASPGA